MTEEKIKEMLNGIINNGEKWEYRWCTADGWSNWKEYKLGYEIYDGYEYRKVEKNKTWLEESMELQGYISFPPGCPDYEKKKICFKKGAKEVCKKILEEVDKEHGLCSASYYLKLIIKGLGIELE